MRKQVAILFSRIRPQSFAQAVAAGISEQAKVAGEWQFQSFSLYEINREMLARTALHGAIPIGLIEEEAYVMEALAQCGIPTVHAGDLHLNDRYHEVRTPNSLLGELGAKHLMDCGLQHLAFIGQPHSQSMQRGEAFAKAVEAAGRGPVAMHTDRDERDAMRNFLIELPRSTGVMVANDDVGWKVAREALGAGIAIPEQLALLGCGNDNPWCMLVTPPMSSIERPGHAIGRRALLMLDDLINGRPSPMVVDISSAHVVERESSAFVNAESPEIARAIGFVRNRRGVGITVYDVMEHAGVSRSTLERGMKQVLGRSPLQEIARLRLESAKDLLANTDLPIKAIAVRCGYGASKHLCKVIHATTGLSPRQYRSELRSYPPPDPAPNSRRRNRKRAPPRREATSA